MTETLACESDRALIGKIEDELPIPVLAGDTKAKLLVSECSSSAEPNSTMRIRGMSNALAIHVDERDRRY